MEQILNIGLSSPIIKEIKDLKRHPKLDKVVVEDLAVFTFMLQEKRPLDVFIYAPELIYSDEAKKVIEYYSKCAPSYTVSKKTYQAIAEKDNATGLIGIVPFKFYNLKDINPTDYDFIVVADKLENPGNLGTLLRTMDGAGASLLINVDPIVNLTSPKLVAASRGMNLFIKQVRCSYEEAQKFLLDNKYTIYLGEPDLGKPYNTYDYQGKIALVVGGERYGINPLWYQHDHQKVFIPMSGKMGCLNVSIAAAILIYEAKAKRTSK